MRALDWERTPLGPPAAWPANLRTAVSLCLTSRIPVVRQMGGGALARELAVRHPSVPVLFTSGSTDDEVARRGLLAPGQPLARKPLAPDTLARAVKELLRTSVR